MIIIFHNFLNIFEHLYENFSKSACMLYDRHACTSYILLYMIVYALPAASV